MVSNMTKRLQGIFLIYGTICFQLHHIYIASARILQLALDLDPG